jgi:transcriptional regulator with XRE-family HTH domain
VEASVADIGADLRRARMSRDMSVEDISRATKITQTLIRAIESDDFAKLPGGLFTRGYLRAYAREVGLNAEEIIERYRGGFEAAASPPVEAPAQQKPEPVSHSRYLAPVADDGSRSRHVQILQLCLILMMVALYFALVRKPKLETPSEAKTVAPVAVAPKTETPVATKGTAVPPPPETLTLELRPRGPCWVEVTAQGKRLFGRLMDGGQHESITLTDDVTMRIGDPGAFAFTIDGAEGRSLGPGGQPVTVRIDKTNYKTFLTPRPQDAKPPEEGTRP